MKVLIYVKEKQQSSVSGKIILVEICRNTIRNIFSKRYKLYKMSENSFVILKY